MTTIYAHIMGLPFPFPFSRHFALRTFLEGRDTGEPVTSMSWRHNGQTLFRFNHLSMQPRWKPQDFLRSEYPEYDGWWWMDLVDLGWCGGEKNLEGRNSEMIHISWRGSECHWIKSDFVWGWLQWQALVGDWNRVLENGPVTSTALGFWGSIHWLLFGNLSQFAIYQSQISNAAFTPQEIVIALSGSWWDTVVHYSICGPEY